jgi:hypothetical protein
MKYVISESQFGKMFKRDNNPGPFTKTIYNLDDPNICDYVVTYVEGNNNIGDIYAILIVTRLPTSSSFERKIEKLVSNFIGISPLVMANDNYECKKPEH